MVGPAWRRREGLDSTFICGISILVQVLQLAGLSCQLSCAGNLSLITRWDCGPRVFKPSRQVKTLSIESLSARYAPPSSSNFDFSHLITHLSPLPHFITPLYCYLRLSRPQKSIAGISYCLQLLRPLLVILVYS